MVPKDGTKTVRVIWGNAWLDARWFLLAKYSITSRLYDLIHEFRQAQAHSHWGLMRCAFDQAIAAVNRHSRRSIRPQTEGSRYCVLCRLCQSCVMISYSVPTRYKLWTANFCSNPEVMLVDSCWFHQISTHISQCRTNQMQR